MIKMTVRLSAAAALLIAVLAPQGAQGAWKRQAAGINQKTGYLDLCAVSATFAAAAGVIKQGQDKPVVMITRDGKSWSPHFPHTSTNPFDIQIFGAVWFEDDKQGYVGGLGMIWSTSDGGKSWTAVNKGGLLAGPINDIHTAAPGTGVFAVTSKGELLRSTDSGKTWPALAKPLGAGVALTHVHFVDADTGWVTAGAAVADQTTKDVTGYKDGALARTMDGGVTWTTVFSGEQRAVVDVAFIDADNGWMVSRSMQGSVLEQTSDGGKSWAKVSTPQTSKPGKISALAAVRFFDRCEGWLVGRAGEQGPGVLWRSEDGGSSWTEVTDRAFLELGKIFGIPIQASLNAVAFADRSVGFAGGDWETLYRYDADGAGPPCGGGGGGLDDSIDEGCCAMGGAPPRSVWLALPLLALLLLARRRD
jgi:photosystem II stability/assembly factor-like uncharacterized protein